MESESKHREAELDALFRRYREEFPDAEPGAEFMPRLWQKIEARRGFALALRRWTQGFITAAAGICLLMGMYLASAVSGASPVYTATYLDVLASDLSSETLAYADLVHAQGESDLQ